MFLILFFYLFESICTIDLEDKRTAISAVLAEINLSDTPPDNGKNILALAFRTVIHSKQLYMSIRYKN